MSQAKTLTHMDFERVLHYVAQTKHRLRNRALLLITHWAGLRVGEVAALRVIDVMDEDGRVKTEIRLLPEQTKGRHARTVFINEKLRTELQLYANQLVVHERQQAFFYTQKNNKRGFTANTLTIFFRDLYRAAGLAGASSHSGRRSFITNLANKGVGVRLLMSLAGHRNIATTQRYIDVNDELKRQAVELL